ncbi:hypothetical protein ONR57_20725 [Hoyosella sp. YIM 151337]|uniref:hypothetical protein n=1 Tax=Hoyosella sp. YIM 151337 TaxID=2992742 RepID=UPI0022366450|nr:hypothetical protein [Hoyosella sp. YIM 151337]MCW4355734.1 hypothetical protein [Hoyosella sp. YIM 151337]
MSDEKRSFSPFRTISLRSKILVAALCVIALFAAAGAAVAHAIADRKAEEYFEHQAEFIELINDNVRDPSGLENAVETVPTLESVAASRMFSKQFRVAEAQSLALNIYTELLREVLISFRSPSQEESLVQPLTARASAFRGSINDAYSEVFRRVGIRALKIEEDFESARSTAIEFHARALSDARAHKTDIADLTADNEFMRSRVAFYHAQVDGFIDAQARALEAAEESSTMGALYRTYALNERAYQSARERLNYGIRVLEQGHYDIGFYVRALIRSIGSVPAMDSLSADQVRIAVMAGHYGDMGREVLANPPTDQDQTGVAHIALARYFLQRFVDEIDRSDASERAKESYAERAERALHALSLLPDAVIDGRQTGTGAVPVRASALRDGAYDVWTTSNYPHPGLDLTRDERSVAWDAAEYDEALQFFEDQSSELMPRDDQFKNSAQAYVEAMRVCIAADLKYIRGLETNFRESGDDPASTARSREKIWEVSLTHAEESRACRQDIDRESEVLTDLAADTRKLYENAANRFAQIYR